MVLSEIMFDPLGNEAHDEFVEFYNTSETDSIDLAGWQLSDGAGFDAIEAVASGLILQPGQFAVILDGSYFGNSTAYDGLIPENSLILKIGDSAFGSAGLSNSTPETISLIDAFGFTVSEYTYSLDNAAGFSDEKIDLTGPNTPENWANSRVQLGTPGARNSVSPLDHDLAIFSDDLAFSPQSVCAGESISVSGLIRNIGLLPANNYSVILSEDQNSNGQPEGAEELARFEVTQPLASGDSTRFEFRFENIAAGRHLFFAAIEFSEDENLANNLAQKELRVGHQAGVIVLNEIMYSPLTSEPEWVEVFNPTSQTVSLRGWRLTDSDAGASAFVENEIVIPPGGYFVLAEDTLTGLLTLPAGTFTILKNWPALNNEFDSVVLYDLSGNQIDRVDYRSNWGGERGFSLERINPQFASNDSINWSTCVVFAGGTPGAQNSIFAEFPLSEAAITISPNPFSPDDDGHDDFAFITFKLPVTTAAVNVKIYDLRGRLIRFLANNEPAGAEKTLRWDGRDYNNQMARMGIYVVYLQALNAQAGVVLSEKKSVVLAARL